jgi:uncharacterized protein (DUF433 family)
MNNLIGIGVYTPAEAGRLLHVPPGKIARWLRGHQVRERGYKPLWEPQVDLGDGHVYLGFRDLMEVRVADKFIEYGISPQRVRAAILLAREVIGEDRPLSTDRFRTDGRNILVRVVETDEKGEERERLLNLFRRQYEFRQIIEPLLKTINFDERGAPLQWWPLGHRANILVDPARAFGQPIDAITNVPTAVLAAAGRQEGIDVAASAYGVPRASVKRALVFEATMERRAAA